MIKIDFLYFEDCPNWKEALELLKESCFEKAVPESVIRLVKIRNEGDAVKHRFLGSPSIQINNADIEESRIDEEPLYGCRIYRDNQGVPSKKLIESAIEAALK